MIRKKLIWLLITLCVTAPALSASDVHPKGRKLFGGYRIAPRRCEPSSGYLGLQRPGTTSICMFNYECSRRGGEVVGACMDGFLFGACCQLSSDSLEKSPLSNDGIPDDLDLHDIDHVPEVPILLSADGTPLASTGTTPYTRDRPTSVHHAERPQVQTTGWEQQFEQDFPSLLGHEQVLHDLKLPTLLTNSQSHGQQPQATLHKPDAILQVADPVDQLPQLFSQGLHNKRRNETVKVPQQQVDTVLLSANGSALYETNNPDEFFRPSSNEQQQPKPTSATTSVSHKTRRPGTSSKAPNTKHPSSSSSHKQTLKGSSGTTKVSHGSKTASSHTSRLTTPMSKDGQTTLPYKSTGSGSSSVTRLETTTPIVTLSTRYSESELIQRTTTLAAYETTPQPVDLKVDSEVDKQEIAINHIINILNDTGDAKVTTSVTSGPTTYNWVQSTDGSSSPAMVKIITAGPTSSLPSSSFRPTTPSSSYTQSPNASPNYYHYNTAPVTEPTRYSSSYYASPSSASSFSPSTRPANGFSSSKPTANPPAPTVIVLGPLGTEYTTVSTQSTPTRVTVSTGGGQKYPGLVTKYTSTNTARPVLVTKKPGGPGTIVTHNISTVISGNKQVLSYISVNLKDPSTPKPVVTSNGEPHQPSHSASNIKLVTKRPSTLTTWTDKPSFHLKPSTSLHWHNDELVTKPTTTSNCDKGETTTINDLNNFPPVRHPELDSSVTHHQDRPTLVSSAGSNGEIIVPNILQSTAGQGNKTTTSVTKRPSGTSSGTKRPSSSSGTKRPTSTSSPKPSKRPGSSKPNRKGTRKPTASNNKVTTTQKTTKVKVKPTSPATRKPTTSKRKKPVKKVTTPTPLTIEETTVARPAETTTRFPEITPNANFRDICGIRPLMKTGRIVGGKGATFGEWPWQVLVREATWLGLFTKNKCGGVLITDKFVITAAHCQPGFLASLVAVFGEHDISGELESRRSVTRNVKRVIVNRGYDPATFENDLALLELETPIQFDAHIVPICMPDDKTTNFVNKTATVTGWGRLKYNGGVPSVLQEVKVPIMENSVCQDMFIAGGHSKRILESFMCAGYANGEKDSCEGDSGGPLTLQRPDGRWMLVGTVSHGIKCAAPFLPGVYMRMTYYRDWLNKVTGV
ncbi:hypothetical protein QAD02_022978 [Eretmocerus hayati]|uniref:Uncharacterized protein n=1 Tax=Eretmocerus hayati TaxID=131215 RepID=A0ACC2PX10_9HYME|nr:hypothetical protein QAD02_022978 [Eretmocerus hayati]